MINEFIINQNNILSYDNLNQQVIDKFNRMCDNANIEKNKRNEKLTEILSFIQIQKINLQFEINQKEEMQRLINKKTSKIEKERNLAHFLSKEITNISNIYLLNLINFIKNKDIPSLKSIDSFYLVKCNDIISKAAPFLRKEMLDHIDNDTNTISKIFQQNSKTAINLIEEQKKQNIKALIELSVRVGGMIAGVVLHLTNHPILGELVFHVCKVPSLPFKLVNEPADDKFALKIGKKIYEASQNDLCSFCSDIASRLGPMAKSVFDTMFQEIDISQINNLPVDFDSRDYSQYFENLIQNE